MMLTERKKAKKQINSEEREVELDHEILRDDDGNALIGIIGGGNISTNLDSMQLKIGNKGGKTGWQTLKQKIEGFQSTSRYGSKQLPYSGGNHMKFQLGGQQQPITTFNELSNLPKQADPTAMNQTMNGFTSASSGEYFAVQPRRIAPINYRRSLATRITNPRNYKDPILDEPLHLKATKLSVGNAPHSRTRGNAQTRNFSINNSNQNQDIFKYSVDQTTSKHDPDALAALESVTQAATDNKNTAVQEELVEYDNNSSILEKRGSRKKSKKDVSPRVYTEEDEQLTTIDKENAKCEDTDEEK